MPRLIQQYACAALATCVSMSFAAGVWAAPGTTRMAANETVAPAGADVIGDFENRAVHNKHYGTLILHHGHEFGWGWSVTTDQRLGGHSVASLERIHPGANGTRGALRICGEVKSGFPYPWAGTIWFPGHEPMQPGDLSAKKELTFWARGTPESYNILLKTGSPDGIPRYVSFVITPQWKEYHIPLDSSFANADLKHVYYIAFSAGNPGKFQFDLDQVKLH